MELIQKVHTLKKQRWFLQKYDCNHVHNKDYLKKLKFSNRLHTKSNLLGFQKTSRPSSIVL